MIMYVDMIKPSRYISGEKSCDRRLKVGLGSSLRLCQTKVRAL